MEGGSLKLIAFRISLQSMQKECRGDSAEFWPGKWLRKNLDMVI